MDVFVLKNESLKSFDYLRGLNSWFLISLFVASIIARLLIEMRRRVSIPAFMSHLSGLRKPPLRF